MLGCHAYARLLNRRHPLVVGHTGENGNRTLHVMTANEVHHGIEIFLRIVLDLACKPPGSLTSIHSPREEVEHHRTQRIVHRRVHLVSGEVFAWCPIGNLVRCILPDLTDHDGVGIGLFKLGEKFLRECRRQLINDIKAPARNALIHPVMEHTVLTRNDKVHIGRIGLIDIWQRVKVPPAVVFIRITAEVIPRVVR